MLVLLLCFLVLSLPSVLICHSCFRVSFFFFLFSYSFNFFDIVLNSQYLSHIPLFDGAKCSCVGVELTFLIISAIPFSMTFSKSLLSVKWTHALFDTIWMTFILVELHYLFKSNLTYCLGYSLETVITFLCHQ